MPTPTDLSSSVAGLAVLANNDLDALWAQVDTADDARDALRDILPALVEVYGSAAAAFAADWYDDLRELTEVRGSFTAIPADMGPSGADALAGWGVAPLYKSEPDWAAAKTLVAGGLQRRIANASRYTIAGSAIADPMAVGWKRIGSGACPFCRMLIERDELYTEATADFASHDHCNCSAYPLIKGAEPIDVKDYVQTTRTITDADRARVREYLRTH